MENGKIITNDSEIANIFIDFYTNIVKYSSGNPPSSIADTLPPGTSFNIIINGILNNYKYHPSITCIKEKRSYTGTFKFRLASEIEILKLLKSLDSKKAIGIDGLPSFIKKLSAEILAKPLTSIINESIRETNFPTSAKFAAILPLFKKDERSQKNNYRPVGIWSAFSKILGTFLQNQIVAFMDNFLSIYVSAYRKGHITQHVLVRLIEEWKNGLDDGYIVGSVLMDLSEAFDCIPHDLLIAKLVAYGFERSALKYII